MTHAPAAPTHQLARDILLVVVRERARHLAFVRRRMAPPVDPEDIVQLAWLRATRHLDEIRDNDKLGAWFWRILRHTVLDENERLARERTFLQQLVAAGGEVTPQAMTTCACSLGVLQQLKPVYGEMLRRADLDEEPVDRIAADLGLTVNNATVRLHRARKAMREALLDHCSTDSARACQDCRC